MKFFFVGCVLGSIFYVSNTNFVETYVSKFRNDIPIVKKLLQDIFVYSSNIYPSTLYPKINYGSSSFNRSRCFEDIMFTLRHLDSSWAVKFLDSYGKVPSGVLLGNFMWVGKYYECIDISVTKNETGDSFSGMYCIAEWNITLPQTLNIPLQHLPLKTGMCLPNTCKGLENDNSFKSVQTILEQPLVQHYGSLIQLTSLDCNFQGHKMNIPAKIFLTTICIYFSIVLLASFSSAFVYLLKHSKSNSKLQALDDVAPYDGHFSSFVNENAFISHEREACVDDQCLIHNTINAKLQNNYFLNNGGMAKSVTKFLKCFCLFSNASKVINTMVVKKQLTCIHGIRFLSMAWIILGHTYVHNMDIIGNYVELWRTIDSLPFQAVIQGTFSVDTFFLIGGFLLSYLYLEEADKSHGKINWLKLCLHRFIRITPVYLILIGFKTFLFKHIASGPFWNDEIGISSCEKYWWWNLLYINNFLPLNSMCISWSWYLANDMQFFIISTLVLYILWRWHNVGIIIFLSMLIGSWVVTGSISYLYDIMPLFAAVSEAKDYSEYYQKMQLSWNLIYSKPYCRISSHIIGILLAFILHKKCNQKHTIPLWVQVFGWCASVFCCISVVYGLYHVKPNPMLFHLYNALSRSSFSFGVAWVIYCCVLEHGGFINKILSMKFWIPLSRLTFCAYLFHPVLMSWYFQSQKVPLYFTHANMVVCYLAFLLMSYGLAFIMNIVFETPLINLEKLILKREKK